MAKKSGMKVPSKIQPKTPVKGAMKSITPKNKAKRVAGTPAGKMQKPFA